ncbi:MAG TPA: LPS assembly protein LptD [Candidatus Saccharimonadales bacterium]|nr:LPS assembly protein LptD [Candidatus Saccharimonadales bacterium]
MTLRTLRIITVTIVSHLLLATLAFTSQLPASSSRPVSGAWLPAQEVTIKARQQEKQGDIYKLDEDVEISFQSYLLRADHVTYNADSGAVEATGRVVFDGGPHDAHLTAGHANYNVKTETGTFYDVFGTFGAVVRGRTVVLTTSNPFVIAGKEVRKVDRDRYIVLHGSITSCAEQNPTWTFNAEKIDVVAGEDAKLYHSTFRLLKLPVFYFPYTQAPASAIGRTSGFLLPAIGESSTKGFIFGDSFYWAINRSNDITIGAEYFSKRGWSQTAQIRMRPTENTSLELRYFGVLDRGVPVTTTQTGPGGTPVTTTTNQDQGGEDIRLIAETSGDHWRSAADIEYLNSFLFRQAFSETYSQAVNSEVKSVAFISHNLAGLSLNGSAGRYQNFYQDPLTNSFSNQIRILHMPVVEANGLERTIASSPFVWGVDTSAGGLQRSEPGFVTANLVGRLDIRPRIALPLEWNGWDLRPEIAVHDTLYTQQNLPSVTNTLGKASGDSLNRRAVEASIELRPPVMEKVLKREYRGRSIKHVIEPVFTYRYTTGIGQFQNIIRFDSMDILSNTSEFEYDVIQRIYGRRRSTRHEPGCEAPEQTPAARTVKSPAYIPGMSALAPRCEDESKATRELLSWEVKQKYYVDQKFGGALVPGRRNVFTTTDDLTGIAFLETARTWTPVVSKLRIQTSANTDIQWQFDYDPVRGRINSSATFVEYRRGEYFVGGSHAFFHLPANSVTETFSKAPLVFNQFRYLVGYGHPNKRGFAGGFSAGYDQNRDFLQYGAAQTSYNWDCCGLSFEFRRLALPNVRNENQYRFAFTLANIGTFGNLRKQERLY